METNAPDRVTGAQTDPLWDGTVLLLGFGEFLLGAEGFLGLCRRREDCHRSVKLISFLFQVY